MNTKISLTFNVEARDDDFNFFLSGRQNVTGSSFEVCRFESQTKQKEKTMQLNLFWLA